MWGVLAEVSFIHFREEATAIVKRSCSVCVRMVKSLEGEHEVRTEASHVNHGRGGRQRLAGNVIVQITMSAVRRAAALCGSEEVVERERSSCSRDEDRERLRRSGCKASPLPTHRPFPPGPVQPVS